MKIPTAQEIITEAIEISYSDARYDNERETTLGKLLSNPFQPFQGESKRKSAVITYLSDRLIKEMREKAVAEEMMANMRRIALKCVEIYGIEAVQKFNENWQTMVEKLKSDNK